MAGGDGAGVSRRTVLRGLGVLGGGLGLAVAVPGCASPFAGIRLRVATGGTQGEYFPLGTALARAWTERLGLDVAPEVLTTAGSVDNLDRLAKGAADIAFSQVDTAAEQVERTIPDDPRAPRALARIYDDVVHVVVPTSSAVTALGGLRGARVSVGTAGSGYFPIAQRLLAAAGLTDRDIRAERLGLAESTAALREGRIDAFFWSGALPTSGVTALAADLPIQLLDLDDVLAAVRLAHPVYASGTVPAGSYGISDPISSLFVRNFLLVAAAMPDELAGDLVDTLFQAQEQLALVSQAALTIDLRAAIGTQPVPLHPGAESWFRDAKI